MTGKKRIYVLITAVLLASLARPCFAADRPFGITAHRGVKKFAPENTIASIQKAIDMGLDYVEIDIRETSDGVMVLMHNSTVDATTDGTGPVDDLTLDEIKSLDAGVKFSEDFRGTRVPTLEEALTIMKGHIKGYLDFKAGSLEKLVEIVEKCDMAGSVVLYGSVDEAVRMKQINEDIVVMPHVDNPQQLALLLKAVELKAIETSILVESPEKIVEEAHNHHIRVFMDILGPFDNKIGLIKALKMRVDVIQTDNPDVILELLQKH